MRWSEKNITVAFRNVFDTSDEPLIVRAPGRVNIIGEHTDYNEGFVLPAAIDKAAYVAITRRKDERVCLYATQFEQRHDSVLTEMTRSEKLWPNYILGVADQLQKAGNSLGGFNLLIDGDVPVGAGLSSSAALECATVLALNELFELHYTRAEMAHIAQQAEHEFAGVKCGVMDMFASLFGKKGHVINLDCRNLFYEYVPLNLREYTLLLLDTNVKHRLSSSAYNTRRHQCEQGVAWIHEQVPAMKALRDATQGMLDAYVLPKDRVVYQRCKYVVEENQRLLQACEDLKRGDIRALGQKMFATHEGLRKEYEVSCAELDFLVDQVRGHDAVLGARMMGGGFGGCTINLVRETEIEKLVAAIRPAYEEEMKLPLTHYVVCTEDGAGMLSKRKHAAA